MLDWLARRRLYIRFSRSEIWALCVRSGREYRDLASVALQSDGAQRRILAVGREVAGTLEMARAVGEPGVVVVHPFDHERMIIGDFEVAEALMRYVLVKLTRSFVRPEMIFHPQHGFHGGLTDIERRALYDLPEKAGASQLAIHGGDELSLDQALQYPLTPIKLPAR